MAATPRPAFGLVRRLATYGWHGRVGDTYRAIQKRLSRDDNEDDATRYFVNPQTLQIANQGPSASVTALTGRAPQKTKPVWNARQQAGAASTSSKKFGVLWASTVNIGDDVQTLAAINLLKKHGVTESEIVLIDRERLSLYDGPPVTLIMNGWFTHNQEMFEPPPHVSPLIVSMHIAREELIDRYQAFLKEHGPVGCRDLATVEMMKKRGIDAYFSGCLTLTFDESDAPRSGTYASDLWDDPIPSFYRGNDLSNLQNPISIRHDAFVPSNPVRFLPRRRLMMAQDLLHKFRTAELVVTTRLHCALPCRAMNTDVIFLHSKIEEDPRFGGLRPYLNGYDGGQTDSLVDLSYRTVDRAGINQIKAELSDRIKVIVDKTKSG